MPALYDWGLDANGDLVIENNDYTYVLSDEQHIQDTVDAYPLWWSQFPADGVGIKSYQNSSGKIQELMGKMKQQLQTDGYSCNNPIVQINGNQITYNPNAIRL